METRRFDAPVRLRASCTNFWIPLGGSENLQRVGFFILICLREVRGVGRNAQIARVPLVGQSYPWWGHPGAPGCLPAAVQGNHPGAFARVLPSSAQPLTQARRTVCSAKSEELGKKKSRKQDVMSQQ